MGAFILSMMGLGGGEAEPVGPRTLPDAGRQSGSSKLL
jgi:hypothetical protein